MFGKAGSERPVMISAVIIFFFATAQPFGKSGAALPFVLWLA
jgi:hypothetical protein